MNTNSTPRARASWNKISPTSAIDASATIPASILAWFVGTAFGLCAMVADAQTVLEDPAGDTFFFTSVAAPNAPDLLEVTAGYDDANAIVTATFRTGTMQQGVVGTFYVLGLDLDLNLTTGGSFISGSDRILLFATDLSFATICEDFPFPLNCGAQVPVATGADTLSVTIPLDAGGIDDDGTFRFGFVAGFFDSGQPFSEDGAFDGVSGNLDRVLTAKSSRIGGEPTPEIAPFLFYPAKTAPGTTSTPAIGPIRLDDTFGGGDYTALHERSLGFAAEISGAPVSDPEIRLADYRVRRGSGHGGFTGLSEVRLANRCHDLVLRLKRTRSLLVPSLTSHSGPVAAPDPIAHDVDHLLCYRARVRRKAADGTRLPRLARGAQLDVAFAVSPDGGATTSARFDLGKITKTCVPAAKSGTPNILNGPLRGDPFLLEPAAVDNPDAHLVCYRAKLASTTIPQSGCACDTDIDPRCSGDPFEPPQPGLPDALALHVGSQLGGPELAMAGSLELCLPSSPPTP